MVLYDSILGLPIRGIMGFDDRVPFKGTGTMEYRPAPFLHEKLSSTTRSERGLKQIYLVEASKGGMKVSRIKDPLYKDSYFGITPTYLHPTLGAL